MRGSTRREAEKGKEKKNRQMEGGGRHKIELQARNQITRHLSPSLSLSHTHIHTHTLS